MTTSTSNEELFLSKTIAAVTVEAAGAVRIARSESSKPGSRIFVVGTSRGRFVCRGRRVRTLDGGCDVGVAVVVLLPDRPSQAVIASRALNATTSKHFRRRRTFSTLRNTQTGNILQMEW